MVIKNIIQNAAMNLWLVLVLEEQNFAKSKVLEIVQNINKRQKIEEEIKKNKKPY